MCKIVISSFLLNLVFISLPSAAVDPSKVAIIDPAKILNGYPKAQQALRNLSEAETQLKSKINSKRKQINQARKANKTETELQMMAEQFRLEIEPEAKKLEEKSKSTSSEIEQNIKNAIESVANKDKYDVVLQSQVVLYGGTDISDLVLIKLTNGNEKK